MDFRPIFYVTGALLSILALSMTIPMLVDLHQGNPDWQAFLICIVTTLFFGGSLVLTNAGSAGQQLTLRQSFVLTTISWLGMATFGAMPMWLSNQSIDFTDAFFETMSGITTTGSTVLVGLDHMPPGLLLWRSILNWLGGIGFILMAILILPFLKVGGMQLFRMESSDKSDKAMPRLQRIGVWTGIAYVLLTGLCALCYWMAGMSGFDAINHSMTTIATGGLSTHDSSFGYFTNPVIHWLAAIFMISGSVPFILYVREINGDHGALFRNSQVQAFLLTLLIAIIMMTSWLVYHHSMPLMSALRHVTFNVVSVLTTTGFSTADYMQWGALPVSLFFILTFLGGCTGSTSGGIKTMRLQIMGKILNRHLKKLQQPTLVLPLRYEGHPVADDVPYSVMVFIFMYLACFTALSIGLGLCGLDLITALSGAATSLSNVGPGLGSIIGPVGNFSTLPDAAKWILSLGMLLGRLEMFTVLILLTPYFWHR